MRNQFDLLDDLLAAADPFLNENDRGQAHADGGGGDTIFPVLVVIAAVIRTGHPMPVNLIDQLRDYLQDQAHGFYADLATGALSDVTQIRTRPPVPPGDYHDHDHAVFVLQDLGLADANHDVQAAGIRQWLTTNRPSPALRYSLSWQGFGHLLDPPEPYRQHEQR